MSGICAGFEGEVELGSLLVSDPTWEHQSGKWKGEDFKLSHYQEPLANNVRTILHQIIEEDPSCSEFRSDLSTLGTGLERAATIAPTVSGSAVIASTPKADEIKEQHRKIGGLDMEVYGLYRAAALHADSVNCFAAKTVVDLANEAKGDDLHQDGAIFSARFVAQAIERILNE
jgi:nucleoside phosphorylase